jgi:hypothetical protein
MRRIVPDTQAASLEITNSNPSLDARVTYFGGEAVLRDIFLALEGMQPSEVLQIE